ncbi:MAG: aromatic-ring-hydroxylating dioxygenase subunit beta [Gammaproteobacteria bacterium]|nr:aromatic-ring-hydroxylating dioxygenase subunit beta [Gammaproteobacteria bacterium]NIR84911.1 aromatic-ring-hydroxylating dioxygenase subunit beta [Gammaproteobacteria bacterium]NIR91760.1 aromatic-ring-hydroxylating dioxygenase subunit beta [Gammaproteobacteria bacterium]NIU05958.1 aromatic-ring-hydroxylating dioxygenase subunit beta [Gammaproteobacteria bacterium]NIV53005.1 aromatic-ring-hydroxylating dioxygenase subunit beta [Gammaproteobacteria bacterium]
MKTQAESTGSEVRELVQALQHRYVDALDSKDMAGWLACFDQDGAYYVTGADNEAAGLPICLMMDDSYERLVDRVTYVTKVWPGSFEDYQTRHFVQPLHVESHADGLYRVQSNVAVFATDPRGRTSLFVAGRYEDLVRITGGAALFKERRVIMDTFATPGVVVYPL